VFFQVRFFVPCGAWVSFSGLTPGLRPDWRPGLRPGLFSFAPSGLGFGGVAVGVTCVLSECLDAGWLASANAGSLDCARDDSVGGCLSIALVDGLRKCNVPRRKLAVTGGSLSRQHARMSFFFAAKSFAVA
jgi:hypothetical protein